jgi:hypothetical protein
MDTPNHLLMCAIAEMFEAMQPTFALSEEECRRVAGVVRVELATIAATAQRPIVGVPSQDARLAPRQLPTHRLALIAASGFRSEESR